MLEIRTREKAVVHARSISSRGMSCSIHGRQHAQGSGQAEGGSVKATRWEKSPWQKIMAAAKKGRGLRLTSKEVFDLSRDDAIATTAGWYDDEEFLARADIRRATEGKE
jgi:hypothetical protein